MGGLYDAWKFVNNSTILHQSTAVRTLVHPYVATKIGNVVPDYHTVKPYTTNIKKWLLPVVDLTDFYVYPMNGITEGINWWIGNETRSIKMSHGEYQWVTATSHSDQCVRYQSVPQSVDGNITLVDTSMPVALDLAYVGSTVPRRISIPSNVEYAFYSLSKSFGIGNVRTGWFFSRKADKKQEALVYGAKYYNYIAHNIAETVINNFDIDFVHTQWTDMQRSVCDQLSLTPSDSVWIATTTDPVYQKFRRHGDTARVCLAGVFNE